MRRPVLFDLVLRSLSLTVYILSDNCLLVVTLPISCVVRSSALFANLSALSLFGFLFSSTASIITTTSSSSSLTGLSWYINEVTLCPRTSNRTKDGSVEDASSPAWKAPVIEPGLTNRRLSNSLTLAACVVPLSSTSTFSLRCTAASESLSPAGMIWLPWMSPTRSYSIGTINDVGKCANH